MAYNWDRRGHNFPPGGGGGGGGGPEFAQSSGNFGMAIPGLDARRDVCLDAKRDTGPMDFGRQPRRDVGVGERRSDFEGNRNQRAAVEEGGSGMKHCDICVIEIPANAWDFHIRDPIHVRGIRKMQLARKQPVLGLKYRCFWNVNLVNDRRFTCLLCDRFSTIDPLAYLSHLENKKHATSVYCWLFQGLPGEQELRQRNLSAQALGLIVERQDGYFCEICRVCVYISEGGMESHIRIPHHKSELKRLLSLVPRKPADDKWSRRGVGDSGPSAGVVGGQWTEGVNPSRMGQDYFNNVVNASDPFRNPDFRDKQKESGHKYHSGEAGGGGPSREDNRYISEQLSGQPSQSGEPRFTPEDLGWHQRSSRGDAGGREGNRVVPSPTPTKPLHGGPTQQQGAMSEDAFLYGDENMGGNIRPGREPRIDDSWGRTGGDGGGGFSNSSGRGDDRFSRHGADDHNDGRGFKPTWERQGEDSMRGKSHSDHRMGDTAAAVFPVRGKDHSDHRPGDTHAAVFPVRGKDHFDHRMGGTNTAFPVRGKGHPDHRMGDTSAAVFPVREGQPMDNFSHGPASGNFSDRPRQNVMSESRGEQARGPSTGFYSTSEVGRMSTTESGAGAGYGTSRNVPPQEVGGRGAPFQGAQSVVPGREDKPFDKNQGGYYEKSGQERGGFHSGNVSTDRSGTIHPSKDRFSSQGGDSTRFVDGFRKPAEPISVGVGNDHAGATERKSSQARGGFDSLPPREGHHDRGARSDSMPEPIKKGSDAVHGQSGRPADTFWHRDIRSGRDFEAVKPTEKWESRSAKGSTSNRGSAEEKRDPSMKVHISASQSGASGSTREVSLSVDKGKTGGRQADAERSHYGGHHNKTPSSSTVRSQEKSSTRRHEPSRDVPKPSNSSGSSHHSSGSKGKPISSGNGSIEGSSTRRSHESKDKLPEKQRSGDLREVIEKSKKAAGDAKKEKKEVEEEFVKIPKAVLGDVRLLQEYMRNQGINLSGKEPAKPEESAPITKQIVKFSDKTSFDEKKPSSSKGGSSITKPSDGKSAAPRHEESKTGIVNPAAKKPDASKSTFQSFGIKRVTTESSSLQIKKPRMEELKSTTIEIKNDAVKPQPLPKDKDAKPSSGTKKRSDPPQQKNSQPADKRASADHKSPVVPTKEKPGENRPITGSDASKPVVAPPAGDQSKGSTTTATRVKGGLSPARPGGRRPSPPPGHRRSRSPLVRRARSPLSGRRGSPRRRSPVRRRSPGRRLSPGRRVSPGRRIPGRRISPGGRVSPGRRTSPRRLSPRRRGSPGRRFSAGRRSPPGHRGGGRPSNMGPSAASSGSFVSSVLNTAQEISFEEPLLSFIHKTLTGMIVISELQKTQSASPMDQRVRKSLLEEQQIMHTRMCTMSGHLLIRIACAVVSQKDMNVIQEMFGVTRRVAAVVKNLHPSVLQTVANTPIVHPM